MSAQADILRQGTEILDLVLVPHGFAFRLSDVGKGSGGAFASGDYWRGSWRIELHFRYSLGLVSYCHDQLALNHESYLWAVLGSRNAGHYPGFSDDPLAAFGHLAADVQQHFGAFLRGDLAEFERVCKEAQRRQEEWSRLSPFQRLSTQGDHLNAP